MRLKEARQAYYDYSENASKIVRQIGLAGIALIWVFRTEDQHRKSLPHELLLAAIVISVSIGLDLLQYVVGSLTWALYSGYHERRGISESTDLGTPRWINWATLTLFWAKLAAMSTAYGYFIIPFLIRALQ